MRGTDSHQEDLFSYVSPERRVPKSHPLRPIRVMVDRALMELSDQFEMMYSRVGRPSIPPEKLLRALLLQIFYSIRSERLLVEQLDYNLLFRWFVGFSMDEVVWDHSTFSKNRDRLLESAASEAFFDQVLAQAREAGLVSDEHFSVDGTLIEAWASMKSFRPKDRQDNDDDDRGGRNAERDFHGEKRCNDTHESTTDPEARLYKKGKGKESKLAYLGHTLMENRNGLIVDVEVTQATGTAEREAAIAMLNRQIGNKRITVGADKGYDSAAFVEDCRSLNVTPHIAQNTTNRRSAVDERTTRHPGYTISQRIRKRIEEGFGWAKTVGALRKTKFRGLPRLNFQARLTFAAYNLLRIRNLTKEVPA